MIGTTYLYSIIICTSVGKYIFLIWFNLWQSFDWNYRPQIKRKIVTHRQAQTKMFSFLVLLQIFLLCLTVFKTCVRGESVVTLKGILTLEPIRGTQASGAPYSRKYGVINHKAKMNVIAEHSKIRLLKIWESLKTI